MLLPMKIALVLFALLFALVGGTELMAKSVAYGLACIGIAAVLFSGAAVVDAIDRNARKYLRPPSS